MMDQTIMWTLVLLSTFSVVSGQLSCYVCTDCPNIDDIDMVSQPCDFVSPPDTTQTPDTSRSTPHTPPTDDDDTTTTLSTTTMPPESTSSSHNTPPTATTSVVPPTISSSYSQNDIPTNKSIIEVTTDKSTELSNENSDKMTEQQQGSTQISLGPPYRKLIHQSNGSSQMCFRIERTVGGRVKVVRGCVVPADTIHQTCVRANNGTAPGSCRICPFNDCNSTTRNPSTSILLLFTSIVAITLLR